MIRRPPPRLAWWLELRKPGPDPDGIPDLTDDEIAAYLRAQQGAPMTTADHAVTVTWEGGYPRYKFECSAPADALCRAQWACDCETWAFGGVRDGIPWHSHVDADDPLSPSTERHAGKFGDGCNLRDWFDHSDEPLDGSVTLPVRAIFEGDYYRFEVQG